MMLDAETSLATRPERLTTKSEKFYAVNAFNTVSALQKAEQAEKEFEEVSIKEILQWLDELWSDGELELTKKEYKEFREAIEASADF